MDNIFRIKTTLIKEKIVGNLSDSQLDSEQYIKGDIPQSWNNLINNPKVLKIKTGDYEERLIEFIEYPSREKLAHPLLILQGGIGAGKSTALRYALKKSKFCHNCSSKDICNPRTPFVLHMDLLKVDKTDVKPLMPTPNLKLNEQGKLKSGNDQDDSKLWLSLDAHLRQLIPNEVKLSEEEELYGFWKWLSQNDSLITNATLRKLIKSQEYNLENPEVHYNELRMERKIFIKNSSIRDQCSYNILMLKYIRRNYNNYCNIVVLDNVDSLAPYEQREILNFALDMYVLFNCRVIITMRPHTVTLNSHATRFMEVIEHVSPHPFKVLEKRMDLLLESDVESKKMLYNYSKRLLQKIRSHKHMQRTFLNTCGVSVRFAQRNFFNITLSPLLIAKEDGTFNADRWTTNEFYQAFFCDEGDPQTMHIENFNNILYGAVPSEPRDASNIKIRMLHHLFVSQNTSVALNELVQEMLHFGYNKKQIASSLNDLLRKRTPLLWSDNALAYQEHELASKHALMLTPLGKNYYEYVIRDPLYIRECIFHLENERVYGLEDFVRAIVKKLKYLAEKDYEETVTYLERRSLYFYNRIYQNISCIGKFWWDSLGPRLKFLSSDTNLLVDELYGEFIWYKLSPRLELRQGS